MRVVLLICALLTALWAGPAVAATLRVTFTDQATNECGFYVERHAEGATKWDKVAYLNALPGTGPVTYLDTKLTVGVRYYYQVRAFHQGGPSAPSNTASAVATAPDPPVTATTAKQPAPIAPCPKLIINP